MPDSDLTAKARLRHAALEVVAEGGLAAFTARGVAERAGVSPGLIAHHFGSMEGLRRACDEHVTAVVRDQKSAALGGGIDPLAAMRSPENAGLVGYLAAVLADDSPAVADLIDHLVADAVAYLKQAEAAGHVRPAADPEARAALLVMWSLGSLVLRGHVRRLLGVDLTDLHGTDPDDLAAYAATSTDLLGRGLFTPGFADQLMARFAGREEDPA